MFFFQCCKIVFLNFFQNISYTDRRVTGLINSRYANSLDGDLGGNKTVFFRRRLLFLNYKANRCSLTQYFYEKYPPPLQKKK